MAFADPQSVTISGSAISLPRTSAEKDGGTFTAADQNTKLTVSHANGARRRHRIRLDSTKIAADPLMASTNVISSMSVSLLVDVPLAGFDVTQQKAVVDALVAYLTASTGARVAQLLGGEN
jgi:hypothetical protein